MSKFVKGLVVLAVAVIALGSVGVVFAQSSTPEDSDSQMDPFCASCTGEYYGQGGRGSRGLMKGGSQYYTHDEVLHDEFMAAYSAELGLSVEVLNDRLDAGETMAEIALSTGLSFDEFKTLMVNIQAAVIDQAVADGLITEEQGDWMQSRGIGNSVGVGARGRGGRFVNGTGECLNLQSTP